MFAYFNTLIAHLNYRTIRTFSAQSYDFHLLNLLSYETEVIANQEQRYVSDFWLNRTRTKRGQAKEPIVSSKLL